MRKLGTLLLLLALVACVSVVMAQDVSAPPAGRTGGVPGVGGTACPAAALAPPPAAFVDRADALGLSQDQKDKLKTILTNGDTTLAPLRQKVVEATRALRQSIYSSSCDEQKLTQLAADASKAEAAVVSAEIKVWTQIKGVLTADQLSSLQQMLGRRTGAGRRGAQPGGAGTPPAPGQ